MLIGTILSITDSFQLAWQDSVIASNVTTPCLALAQCKPGSVCDGWWSESAVGTRQAIWTVIIFTTESSAQLHASLSPLWRPRGKDPIPNKNKTIEITIKGGTEKRFKIEKK